MADANIPPRYIPYLSSEPETLKVPVETYVGLTQESTLKIDLCRAITRL